MYDTMLLALAIKEAGGTLLLKKETFEEINDNFEIMITKDENQDAILTLVEDDEMVAKIRAERLEDQIKADKRKSIVVPN